MQLWHCHNTRSLRPLWALEEMGLAYELALLPFPPRVFQKDYLALNPLGTVPYFIDKRKDGETHLSESSAICHYLVDRYQRYDFGLEPAHPEYGDYLNWLYQSDATFTFPQTIVLRYARFEPDGRKLPQAVLDYSLWFLARLRRLDAHIIERKYLCAERFTIADITVGYALYLGELLGLSEHYSPQEETYLARLKSRPAFQRAVVIGEDESTSESWRIS